MRLKSIKLEVKKEDCWIGLFWRWDVVTSFYHPQEGWRRGLFSPECTLRGIKLDIWICLLPCLPIHLELIKILPPAKITLIQS